MKNARHLPPEIENALARFIEAQKASAAIPVDIPIADNEVRLLDKTDRAERKLRRAIFANLKPDAITEEFEFSVGDEVVWLVTEGAGGQYKPNEKTPTRARVQQLGKRGVLVQPIEGFRAGHRPSWVQRRSLLPVKHPKAQKLLAERKFVV